ncbi:hypothetical protein D3C86_1466500 [compost metagenome]
MFLQREAAPRHHPSEVAARLGSRAVCPQGLHAQQRQLMAFGVGIVGICRSCPWLDVVAAALRRMPLVDLLIGLPAGSWVLPTLAQVCARTGVVVVAGGVSTAREAVQGNEAADVLGIDFPAGWVVFDRVIRSTVVLPMRAHVVDEHEAVLAVAVFEEIVDTPALGQPLEEREVALVELDLIVAFGVGVDEALVHGKVVAGEQLVQDLHDVQVLENLAIGRERCQMKPGP